MRLVVCTSTSDEECSCSHRRPVEYESAEAFLVNLETAVMTAFKNSKDDVKFAGHKWSLDEFGCYENSDYEKYDPKWKWYFGLVTVYTIDEWFDKEARS